MSRIYLPNAEQVDLMNENLAKIANALASNIDLSTWAGIQKAVRVGVAPDLIPAGTQLTVHHSVYGDMLFDVVAHNHFKSAHDKRAHTMTLMSHNIIGNVQFDNSEAFYYAENELPAGTYNFTLTTAYISWAAGTYQFTLTQAVPQGGQLCISGYADAGMTARQVRVYASPTTAEVSEAVTIIVGNGGTSLGTFGIELNHSHRVSYGSSNYKESAIRQFLNSPSVAGSVWAPQTKFDRPPSWRSSLAGFAGGFDDDFLSVVGEVVVPCATNNTYESATDKNTKYTVTDKFYLASQGELVGIDSNILDDDSVLFSYYEGATNTDLIKYINGSAAGWWTRSAGSKYTYVARAVFPDGALNNHGAFNAFGCVPVCTIV